MRCDAIASDRCKRVTDKNDLGRLWRKAQLSATQHLRDLVKDRGLQWLLNFCNGICFLRLSSSEVVDGYNWVSLFRGVFNPVIL